MPDHPVSFPSDPHPKLLNEYEKLTSRHYKILAMSWAGWVFDFYDLILFTFLLIPISREYNFTNLQMSYVLGGGISLAAVFALLTGAWIWTFPETRGRKLYAGD